MMKCKMNMRMIVASAALCSVLASQAAWPEGYYDGLVGKSRIALREAARKAVEDHKTIYYGSDTWNAFRRTDVHFVDGRQAWWDMYSDDVVYTADGHAGLNIEHSVPNSWWGGESGDYTAYCDVANLNPSDVTANQRKSNFPLGEVASATWTNGVATVGTPVSSQGGTSSYVFEPLDEYKGDFAREYLYMFTVYENISWQSRYDYMYDLSSMQFLKPWAQQLLLKWCVMDPVSDKERNRNEALYKVQGNRNPFIDFPMLAEYIWGSRSSEPFTFEGGKGEESAVGSINADTGAGEVKAVYDMQGRRMDEESLRNVGDAGIYIVVYGDGHTEKVMK